MVVMQGGRALVKAVQELADALARGRAQVVAPIAARDGAISVPVARGVERRVTRVYRRDVKYALAGSAVSAVLALAAAVMREIGLWG